MEELLQLIESLDYKTLKYPDVMKIYRLIEEKVAMYEESAKKLKAERDNIKGIIRERMIEEGIPGVDTDFGRLAPTENECFTMANMDLFTSWLRQGVILDIQAAMDAEGYSTPFQFAIERYHSAPKSNDRLDFLKQACYNSKKIKSMHEDPEDTIPPGIGIYIDKKLSITKPKKGAKKK
jgi:hypothetical protein